MPTNNDTSRDITEIFDIPEELIFETKKAGENESPIKRPGSYVLRFVNLEDEPEFLLGEKTIIGRKAPDVMIKHESLSEYHCQFEVRDGVLWLQDLGSKNGTFLGGKKLEKGKKVFVDAGDNLLIGGLKVKVDMQNEENNEAQNVDELIAENKPEERPAKNEPAKKSGLMAKLKSLPFLNKKKKTPAGKMIAANKPVLIPAGAITRIWALIGDFALTGALYTVVHEGEDFKLMTEDYYPAFKELIIGLAPVEFQHEAIFKSVLDDAENIVPFLALFYFLRFIFTVLSGVSPAQFVMGLRGHYNTLWARVGGILRIILEPITALFLIFDAPALIGKRTLKEVITFTTISPTNNLIRILGAFVVIPIFFVLAIISPLAQDLGYIVNEIPVEDVQVKTKKKKQEGQEENKEIEVMSSLLRFSFKMQEKGNVVYLPDFKVEIRNKKKHFVPKIIFLGKEQEFHGELYLYKLFSLNDWFAITEEGNPLFPIKYPEISKSFHNRAAHNLKKTSEEKSLSSTAQAEVESLFRTSLSLNAETLQDHIFEHGPFLKGYVDLRSEMEKIIEAERIEKVSFFQAGKLSIMALNENDPSSLFLFPLNFPLGTIYKIEWKKGNQSTGLNKFFEVFLSGFKPHNMKKLVDFPSLENSEQSPFTIFTVFEHFFSPRLTFDQAQSLNQFLYNYYYGLAGEALANNKKWYLKLITSSIKRIKILSRQRLNVDASLISKFEQDLTQIQAAIDALDYNFFGVTPISSASEAVNVAPVNNVAP